MNYLFGDSTPSELTSNFLEFFRDALDFSVYALQADERIRDGENKAETLRAEADVEIERLSRFITLSLEGVDHAEKAAEGDVDSPTTSCAAHVREAIGAAQRRALDEVREELASAIAQLEADEAATRAACLDALATLLRPHDPPDAKATLHIALSGAGAYEATREAKAGFGLDWSFRVAIAEGTVFSAPIRLERVMPQLEIRAPQLTGWISKEVKIRPQKLERFLLTELVDDGTKISIDVRSELGSDTGFDFTIEGEWVKGKRVGPEGDSSVGPFDVHADDAPKLIELAEKLRAATPDLESTELITASNNDEPFSTLPSFVTFVEGFVAMMTPIVREIAERSLTPNELVIRRLLTNDRREEIFVSKATLREKFAKLTPTQRAVFAPLGLDAATPSVRPPSARAKSEEPPVRAELPKSQPPSTAVPTPTPPPSKPAAIPTRDRISSSDLKTIPGSMKAPPPPPPPPPPPAPPPPAAPPAPPPSSVAKIPATPEPARNEALVAMLKKIALLSRNGRTEEAYREYGSLFSGAAFAEYRADDQRHALRAMVLAKSPPAATDTIREAHRAALARIEALVETHGDPADRELLGATKLVLGDSPT